MAIEMGPEGEAPAPGPENAAELESQLSPGGQKLLTEIRGLKASHGKSENRSFAVADVAVFIDDDGKPKEDLEAEDLALIDQLIGVKEEPEMESKTADSTIVLSSAAVLPGVYRETLQKPDGKMLKVAYGYPVTTRRDHYGK